MAKFDVFDLTANKVGDIELADSVFNCEVNTQAIFDAVLKQQASWRQGTHAVKNRSEVSASGKKPFRQKGTGRARQGFRRAVQMRGGGIAFGPTPRSYTFKLNKKVKKLALRSGLTLKAQNDGIIVLDSIEMPEIKTKSFVAVMDAFKLDGKTLFVVDLDDEFDNAYISSRNLGNVLMTTTEGITIFDIQNADKLVMTKTAASKIGEVLKDE